MELKILHTPLKDNLLACFEILGVFSSLFFEKRPVEKPASRREEISEVFCRCERGLDGRHGGKALNPKKMELSETGRHLEDP